MLSTIQDTFASDNSQVGSNEFKKCKTPSSIIFEAFVVSGCFDSTFRDLFLGFDGILTLESKCNSTQEAAAASVRVPKNWFA